MKKFRLMTPGPTTIPETVLSKFAEPILHHRTEDFEKIFATLQSQLKRLFHAKNPIICLASTGTGAMEAAMVNLFSPGDAFIFVNGGKFGQRFGKIGQAYGLNPIEYFSERGEALDLKSLRSFIEEQQKKTQLKALCFQASETSTGVRFPVQELASLAKEFNLLSVCDGITAVGIFEIQQDPWGLDVVLSASQKALMLPPGLAFVSFSDRAWDAQKQSKLPKFYFDLARERKAHEKNQTAWTPAISLIQGGVAALSWIEEKGYPEVFAHHEYLAASTRAAVQALGLEIFSKAPSPVLTTVKVPATFTVDQGKKIPKIMQKKHRVVITGGQDELEGKIFRISHFGYTDYFDLVSTFAALELTLKELGHVFPEGASLSALQRLCP